MNDNRLPADPGALILGIVALVIGIAGCCCYGISAIIPLVLAIIGLVMANRSIKEYDSNPEAYATLSRSNMVTAKVINIIAVVMNGIIFIIFGILLLIYGSIFSAAVLGGLQDRNHGQDLWGDDTSWEEDTWEQDTWEADTISTSVREPWEYEEDTLLIESIEVIDSLDN